MRHHQHREGCAVTKVLLGCRHSPWHGAAGVWRKEGPVLGTAESLVPVLCAGVPASRHPLWSPLLPPGKAASLRTEGQNKATQPFPGSCWSLTAKEHQDDALLSQRAGRGGPFSPVPFYSSSTQGQLDSLTERTPVPLCWCHLLCLHPHGAAAPSPRSLQPEQRQSRLLPMLY